MKHIRMFESAEQAADILQTLEYNTLSAIRGGSGISLKPGVPGLKATPFYIDVRGPVKLAVSWGIQMSTDGKTWKDTAACDLPTGKTYFRVASDRTSPLWITFTEKPDSDYDIGGNINSLVKTSFENDTTCYTFSNSDMGPFHSKSKLKSAGNLILPATTLVNKCYQSMFSGCTALTTAPELPATTLAQSCYQSMFRGCTSLTTAPELPATTLAKDCYSGMFYGCANLNYIKCLATDISASGCTSGWVSGVASTGTFVKNPSMSSWTTGISGVPDGWTV